MTTFKLESAVSPQVLRGRRTWCYLVLDENGDRCGTLRKHRRSWMLNMAGRQFTPSAGSMAAWAGIKRAPVKGFRTIGQARAFLRNPTFAGDDR